MIWGLGNERNRNKFVIEYLNDIPSGKSILDAGAGIQRYKSYARHLDYTSQDFGDYQGDEEFANKKVEAWDSTKCDIICDIVKIPVEDSTYDFILCTEVFEHLPRPDKALHEFSRILKPNGKLLLTAPFRCLYHQEPYFFYSGFSSYWYTHFCALSGLRIECIEPNGSYAKDIGQEILRTTTLGSPLQKVVAKLLALPFYLYLYFLDSSKTKTPTSCWGYHLIISKILWILRPIRNFPKRKEIESLS